MKKKVFYEKEIKKPDPKIEIRNKWIDWIVLVIVVAILFFLLIRSFL